MSDKSAQSYVTETEATEPNRAATMEAQRDKTHIATGQKNAQAPVSRRPLTKAPVRQTRARSRFPWEAIKLLIGLGIMLGILHALAQRRRPVEPPPKNTGEIRVKQGR